MVFLNEIAIFVKEQLEEQRKGMPMRKQKEQKRKVEEQRRYPAFYYTTDA